jgi:hypothetical protein
MDYFLSAFVGFAVEKVGQVVLTQLERIPTWFNQSSDSSNDLDESDDWRGAPAEEFEAMLGDLLESRAMLSELGTPPSVICLVTLLGLGALTFGTLRISIQMICIENELPSRPAGSTASHDSL